MRVETCAARTVAVMYAPQRSGVGLSVVRTEGLSLFDVRFKFGPAGSGPVTDADLAQITGLKDQLDRLPELRAPRRPVLQDMTDRLVRSLARSSDPRNPRTTLRRGRSSSPRAD